MRLGLLKSWQSLNRETVEYSPHILHVLLKLLLNKKFFFLTAVSMNSTVACCVIPLVLTNYYSGYQIEKN